MKMIGIICIVCGILALVYQGFTYTKKDNVVDAGPIHITADEEKTVPIPPIVGGVLLVAGAAMIFFDKRKS
jgi:hypothetical protein